MEFSGHSSLQSAMQQQSVSQQPGPISYSTPAMTPGFCAQDTSAHHQQSQMMSQSLDPQQQQSGHATQHYMQQNPQMIPPTPNSMELHGGAGAVIVVAVMKIAQVAVEGCAWATRVGNGTSQGFTSGMGREAMLTVQ